MFHDGAYVYFPSSRAEVPHWLNRDAVKVDDFDLTHRISRSLQKPIFVERSLDQLKQWLLSVLIDARIDFTLLPDPKGGKLPVISAGDNILSAIAVFQNKILWESINSILRAIFDDTSVALVWLGRHSLGRLSIQRDGAIIMPTLDALSAGQATVLSIFGTLLRYGDAAGPEQGTSARIEGICLIDEIDAHMHVDLQHRALPELIKMFPKVQFIVSSHSPLFVLGMEKAFGEEGVAVFEMPSGTQIHAEAYAEFGRVLQVLQETKTFSDAISKAVGDPGKLLVLLEGETDPKYLATAAELLDRRALLDRVEFEWVGAKDPSSGQGFHTGKDGLNRTLSLLRAKPDLVKRQILLLYDNDTNKSDEDYGQVHVRSVPKNPDNNEVEVGIENLLPEAAITGEMFDEKDIKKANGDRVVLTTLNKMRLCRYICEEKRDAGRRAGPDLGRSGCTIGSPGLGFRAER